MLTTMFRATELARLLALGLALYGAFDVANATEGADAETDNPAKAAFEAARAKAASRAPLAPLHATPCVNGMAAGFPCSNIDLLAFVPVSDSGSSSTNSLWGWTDPTTQIEYALLGTNNGTAFYDLSTPDHPRYLGKLPTHTGSSVWRDVRVYADHAYIVSDNNGAHGMQIFDLRLLRGVTTPQTFSETAYYGSFGKGHTIAINEDTGYAYIAGSNRCPAPTNTGAIYMIDIRSPESPVEAGCNTTGGYTHETQCWIYHGPDTAHVGKEICVNSNGSSGRVAIVDVTNKPTVTTLSSTGYAGSRYTHQGWLTDDHRYLLVNDELDESNFGHNARTYVWDVSNLDAPVLVGYHQHALPVIDHNLYVHGQYVYQSDYEAGLRILRMDNLSQAALTEVAYFDTYPASNQAEFNGTWNNYRFPGSGIVIVTGIDEGLFVLEPQLCSPPSAPTTPLATAGGDGVINLSWTGSGNASSRYAVERAQGGCGGAFTRIASGLSATSLVDTPVSGMVTYGYRVSETDAAGQCSSEASSCVEATTTGACTAPPTFTGLAGANSTGMALCQIGLYWPEANAACGGPSRYAVHRSTTAGFTPDASNLIASDLSSLNYIDSGLTYNTLQYYVVRATDGSNLAQEGNRIELAAIADGPPVDGTFQSGAEPGQSLFDTSAPLRAAEQPLAPQHAGWHTSMSRLHGGTRSFWSTTANNLCVSLVSPNLTLTAAQTSTLSFWTAWDTQAGVDGGVVEISNDNGATWTRLTPVGGYPNAISGGGTLCGIAPGQGAFSAGAQLTWSNRTINLSAYAGQTVQVRWLYRSDAATSGEGWFIDDIAVTHAQVPGPCVSALPEAVFANGFE